MCGLVSKNAMTAMPTLAMVVTDSAKRKTKSAVLEVLAALMTIVKRGCVCPEATVVKSAMTNGIALSVPLAIGRTFVCATVGGM